MQNKRHTKHLQQQNAATEKCCKPRKDAEPKRHKPQNTCNRYRPMLASLTAIGHWQINMTFTDGSGRWLYADLLYIYIFSQCSITDVVAICRLIVGHFNIVGHSPPHLFTSSGCADPVGDRPKNLQQDVSTCWNSTFYMMESLLEQKRALAIYAADYDLPATLRAH